MHWQIQSKLSKRSSHARLEELKQNLLKKRHLQTPQAQAQFFHPPHPLTLTSSSFSISQASLDQAIALIQAAITANQSILIFGDYDADGITATAILWKAIHAIYPNVFPFIPHREKHGYGLSIVALQDAIAAHHPDLVITVDNGIVAHQAVEFLNANNITSIITDHHQPAATLPPANCIVHTDTISGAGVAWVLATALLKKLKPQQLDQDNLLDLCTIGTVADLLPALGINRSICFHGLKQLSQSSNPGLKALLTIAGIPPQTPLSSYHIGFIIAPRINAMGRLEHGIDALRLLCATSSSSALNLAKKLDDTNKTRQDITQTMVDLAESMLTPHHLTYPLLIVKHQEFHEGIIGLVAGKLSDKYHRPSIVMSLGDSKTKASARSIKGVNITELIRTQADLLESVGGHPQAAGFTIATDQVNAFSSNLLELSQTEISADLLIKVLDIDCQLELSDISQDLFNLIQSFAPFGIANSKPILTSTAQILDLRFLGQNQQHLKLKLQNPKALQPQPALDAIGFHMAETWRQLRPKQLINLAYTLEQNHFKGRSSLQLVIKDIQTIDPS